ncbi:MAG: threonine/serine exporter [Firmicutes bacterium]|nr:threonine/serine exporter [Bacillota bacterium]
MTFTQVVWQFIIAFIASTAWGVIFRAPHKRIALAGLTGALGWMGWLLAGALGLEIVGRTALGAFAVGISGEIIARLWHEPATVFLTPGIVPLVPGVTIYSAMQAFVVGDYTGGLSFITEALLAAGAIAGGLAVATAVVRSSLLSHRRGA